MDELTTDRIKAMFDEMDKFRITNPWYDEAVKIIRKVEEIQRIYDEAVAATRPRYITYAAGSTAPLTQDQYDILVGRDR